MRTETIYIEIPIQITFSIDPGQKQTHWEPGFPACVEDKAITTDSVIKAVNEYIEEHEDLVDAELMEKTRQRKGADEEYQADIKYNEMKGEKR
jgi:hypothetical protein